MNGRLKDEPKQSLGLQGKGTQKAKRKLTFTESLMPSVWGGTQESTL